MVTAPIMKVGSTSIGEGQPTFVIAELGINHGGDVGVAREMISAATSAGADAIKLQTYRTEERVAPDSPIYDILKKCELGRAQHEELRRAARGAGAAFMSTPFDEWAVELLAELDVEAYKIASFDIVNLELLRKVASRDRPVFVSTGMATTDEIDKALEVIEPSDNQIALLHCVSAYPLQASDANLRVIDSLRDRYGKVTGYSDHTLGIDVAVHAVARGATVIEKHFTLDRTAEGPDHALSADPSQMRELVEKIRAVEESLGSPEIGLIGAEEETLPYRRPSG